VYISEDQMKGHPANTPYKPQAVPPPTSASPAPAPTTVKGSMGSFEQHVDFVCSAQDLYAALLDAKRVSIWSRSPDADISPEAGTLFSLFGGQVSGYVTSVEQSKQIVQRWRLKSWPSSHFATLSLTFDEGSDGVKLHVKASDVPVGEVEAMRGNLDNYYWNPIKSTFGYGALL